MPPITTVPPFSTSTSVLTSLTLISRPSAVSVPRLSLLIFTTRMTLPSGVICGVTSSFSVASTNSTAVAPELVACWNGILVP